MSSLAASRSVINSELISLSGAADDLKKRGSFETSCYVSDENNFTSVSSTAQYLRERGIYLRSAAGSLVGVTRDSSIPLITRMKSTSQGGADMEQALTDMEIADSDQANVSNASSVTESYATELHNTLTGASGIYYSASTVSRSLLSQITRSSASESASVSLVNAVRTDDLRGISDAQVAKSDLNLSAVRKDLAVAPAVSSDLAMIFRQEHWLHNNLTNPDGLTLSNVNSATQALESVVANASGLLRKADSSADNSSLNVNTVFDAINSDSSVMASCAEIIRADLETPVVTSDGVIASAVNANKSLVSYGRDLLSSARINPTPAAANSISAVTDRFSAAAVNASTLLSIAVNSANVMYNQNSPGTSNSAGSTVFSKSDNSQLLNSLNSGVNSNSRASSPANSGRTSSKDYGQPESAIQNSDYVPQSTATGSLVDSSSAGKAGRPAVSSGVHSVSPQNSSTADQFEQSKTEPDSQHTDRFVNHDASNSRKDDAVANPVNFNGKISSGGSAFSSLSISSLSNFVQGNTQGDTKTGTELPRTGSLKGGNQLFLILLMLSAFWVSLGIISDHHKFN